jgi:hypothetical protein
MRTSGSAIDAAIGAGSVFSDETVCISDIRSPLSLFATDAEQERCRICATRGGRD